MDLWEIERELTGEGFTRICGVDEAGRGPAAGPVFAAAVILPPGFLPEKLNDSKKLTEKTRIKLFDEICANAISYGIASADNREIDEINVLNATYLAMNRAIEMLRPAPDIAIIDGNQNKGIECRSICVVGGDGKSASIAAASILAKVSRDRFMIKIAEKYPQYQFDKHKGYCTKLHKKLIAEYGPCEIHRLTYKTMGEYYAGKAGEKSRRLGRGAGA